MAFLTLDGLTVAFDEVGADGPPILLVHGHPFDRSMWRPQLAAFGRAGRRAIAADLRGYGDSAVVPGRTTLDQFARDLLALLAARGVAGRFVVVGLSMGGQIAMEICRQAPDRVAGLALLATMPQAETPESAAARIAMAGRLEREGMAGYAAEVLPQMLAAGTIADRPDIADHVLSMMRRTDPRGAAAAQRGRAERPPYESVLAAYDGPALVVVGDQDAFTTRADADRMHGLLRRSELLWLPGVGHMPNLEQPDAVDAALDRLLRAAV